MDSKMAIVTARSYGLVAVLAAFLALYLASGWRRAGAAVRCLWRLHCAPCGVDGSRLRTHRQAATLPGRQSSPTSCALVAGIFLLVLMQPELAEGEHVPAAVRSES